MTMFREVENKGLPCHLFGYILDAEENSGFFETMDIYFSALGDGTSELEIPVTPMHYNSAGMVHGGVYAGLLDSAMGMAMLTKNKIGVTTSLNIQYLKGAGKGDVLKVEATVTHNGRKMLYCEAKCGIRKVRCWQQDKALFWCRMTILYKCMRQNCVSRENRNLLKRERAAFKRRGSHVHHSN